MEATLQQKYDRLRGIIKDAGKVAVAFSGGVDSTFLYKVCIDLLGENALGITARSETFPTRELEEAKALAEEFGGKHIIIDSGELEVPGFSDNPPNRCFLCKSELFTKLKAIAERQGLGHVFDGSNADDVGDFRPGRVAAAKIGVRSPLEEAGLGKKDIRALSQMLGLPNWDKPSFACLSSRFPYHTKITRPALQQVEKAENILRDFGMRQVRVRHHGNMARIELGEIEMELLLKNHLGNKIASQLKAIGYTYVTLDLEGYRTGSMNATLSTQEMARHTL